MELAYEPLTPERLGDYLDFFDHRAFTDNPRWAGCYCFFPLHDPARTIWQERSKDENREAVVHGIQQGQARGVLAYSGGEVIGWCNAGPWAQFPMLRGVDEPSPDTTGSIMCFVIAPSWRGKGVARGLLAAACEGLRAQGMKTVRARAVRSADPSENHFGPLALYLSAGFEVVAEGEPGVMLVKRL